MCPLSTVQYTCVADLDMTWRESGSDVTATYTTLQPASVVNDTVTTGVFNTVLTDISGNYTHINSYYRQCQSGR